MQRTFRVISLENGSEGEEVLTLKAATLYVACNKVASHILDNAADYAPLDTKVDDADPEAFGEGHFMVAEVVQDEDDEDDADAREIKVYFERDSNGDLSTDWYDA